MLTFSILFAICSMFHHAHASPESQIHYALTDDLSPVLNLPLFAQSKVGIQVINTETGEEVYAHRANEEYIPASVMKVLTAAIAYRTLGPDYRFRTDIFTDGEIEDGVLNGNLFIKGTGDPTLVAEKLWKIIHDLKISGITEVKGQVIYDDTHFNGSSLIPGWTKEADLESGPAYFPALSSLSVNFNTVAIMVRPSTRIGDEAIVSLEYPVPFVQIEADVKTIAPGSKPWMVVERTIEDGQVTFSISGKINYGEVKPWVYYRSIPEPELLFQSLFRQLAKEQGLVIRGRDKMGMVPESATLLTTLYSQPLRELTADMNKHSRNLIAEHLIRAVGHEYSGVATTEAGLDVLHDYLVDLGVPEEDFTLVNGSGLSPDIKIKPSVITAVLLDLYRDPSIKHEFLASLAVNGQEGTLKWRLKDEPHYGKVRGKTGSINGVYCLGGYIRTDSGQVYAFSFLVNDIHRSVRRVREAQDIFASIIMQDSP
ncbi:MAG: D-alanyl-D-alanine carboxypeptidase/D-alanyl-D-alanine endopeptidase [Myxococcota bacterium]